MESVADQPQPTRRDIANRIEQLHAELSDIVARIGEINKELVVLGRQNDTELGGLRETILVVDDSRLVRTLINGLLTGVGYHVIEAGSGEDALAAMKRRDVDLLVLDIKMQDFDGLELLADVRADSDIQNMPVLICTGSRQRIDFQKAAKLGVQGAIPKPVRKEQLLLKVREILTAEEPLEARNEDLETGDSDVFDLTTALVQLDGDRKLLSEVIYAFIEECPNSLRKIRAALQAKQMDGLADEARKLKANLANVGGKRTERAVEELIRLAEADDGDRAREAFQVVEKEVGLLWTTLETYLKQG